jgi:O-antigen/teichoic acid export membrane protein
VVPEEERSRLICLGVVLSTISSILLGLGLCIGLTLFGRGDLVVPAVAWFVSWQLQETMRRVLFAEFRHRTALLGDSISYLGRLAAIFALSLIHNTTLSDAFFAMAAASGIAAAIQTFQVKVDFRRVSLSLESLWAVTKDFWSIGGWSLSNNLVALLRIQAIPWMLAFAFGAASTAGFQAVLNLVNLANPVVIGLCNVIPQAAAQARGDGYRSAWAAVRPYTFIGMLPLIVYYCAALLAPGLVLFLAYGANSPYLDLGQPIQIITVAWIVAYYAEMICSYLHGVDAPKVSFGINAVGAAASVIIAYPLILAFGLTGGCIALLASSVIRTATAYATLTRMMSNDRPSYA